MSLDLIQSTPEFLRLRDEWNALLEQSAIHVPFLRHEFLAGWWENLGGGEWPAGELRILTQRDRKGALTGVAPFFAVGQQLRLLGGTEISDYLDLITAPDNLSPFYHQVFECLGRADFPHWEQLVLDNLLESSPSLAAIAEAAGRRGFTVSQGVVGTAPYLPLPSSWQGYLEGLQDRYGREIDRKLRKAETYFLPVDWYIVEDAAALDSEVDDFLALMANNPQKREFLTDAMVRQMKTTARSAFEGGWLQLAFLVVGDVKVAGYFNFDYQGKIWIYNSGINPMFDNLSPGWVLLSKIIQWSIAAERTEVDFMRGDEEYKYQFGGIDKNILRLEIHS